MNNNAHQYIDIKKETMTKLIEAFLSDDFPENTRLIPYDMRPQGAEILYRCCIYHERAVLKNRIIADLGFPLEHDDERISLSTYAQKALERTEISGKSLTVVQQACKGCVPDTIYVTDLCKGCVARPCEKTCKFKAIEVKDGRALVDKEKCKKCAMCIKSCPYHAITKLTVPCEDVCPVGAMKKDENGLARIDFNKCISCGKCIAACPFGAVHEKSQIVDILKALKEGKKVVAMIAPAILGQFGGNLYQIKTAMLKAGFFDVYETAKGADITAQNEAKEFPEKLKSGKKFMTTSCCTGYIKLVNKHLPEMEPYVSDTKTPLYYISQIVKKEIPDCVSVFVGPCVAKRFEGFHNENVDYVMSFEELESLFEAKKIDVVKQDETKFDKESSKQARNFAVIGGVAQAVKKSLPDENSVKPLIINGINKDSIKKLKQYALKGECEDNCNLIEVMCCEGGCVSGNSTVNNALCAQKQIKERTQQDKDIEKITTDVSCK